MNVKAERKSEEQPESQNASKRTPPSPSYSLHGVGVLVWV